MTGVIIGLHGIPHLQKWREACGGEFGPWRGLPAPPLLLAPPLLGLELVARSTLGVGTAAAAEAPQVAHKFDTGLVACVASTHSDGGVVGTHAHTCVRAYCECIRLLLRAPVRHELSERGGQPPILCATLGAPKWRRLMR